MNEQALWADVLPSSVVGEAQHVQYVQRLVHPLNITWQLQSAAPAKNEAEPVDLWVCAESLPSCWQWHFGRLPSRQLIHQQTASLLLLRTIRWPLRHISIIVRADETDIHAVDWCRWLAWAHRCTVSVLPIVPPWPLLHRMTPKVQPDIRLLLHSNTTAGNHLRFYLEQLEQLDIDARLSLQSGALDDQIRAEVDEADPDLVVIAAETHSRLIRYLYGEIIEPLLRWIDRPLLIIYDQSQCG